MEFRWNQVFLLILFKMIDSVMERAKRAESAEGAMPVNRGELSYAVCGTKRRFVLVKVFRLGGKNMSSIHDSVIWQKTKTKKQERLLSGTYCQLRLLGHADQHRNAQASQLSQSARKDSVSHKSQDTIKIKSC